MSSTMRTEIFIEILTVGLGLFVHFGKSHMFSASFVELKAETEQIIFFCQRREKNDCILHNALLAKGMQGMVWEKKKKKKRLHSYIYLFLFEIRNKSYFRIRTIKFKK